MLNVVPDTVASPKSWPLKASKTSTVMPVAERSPVKVIAPVSVMPGEMPVFGSMARLVAGRTPATVRVAPVSPAGKVVA